ncbi:Phosphotransferase enzyme family protein [Paucidesulfovibrio gracilis DSM 16080]|uniref:Phosphotransferase enzyme family protein n=1 Tax=Paucidesulfovibrio gracilis DSM 16080 TaxID=1121449 RepID=A0A1T4WLW0_9BACT|nr:phosphotransferase [Paucidesulfovibrio gracilis]SKA77621.1 Phosphotransferase enzyme family protein [Paucidesulfovibrio gracilis DSM 16080]
MIELTTARLESYLQAAFGKDARLHDYGDLASLDKQGMKRFGYGKPVLLRYEVNGRPHEGVLSVMRGDKYGHQFYWDRAAVLMFQFETSARMPRHVRPMGLGYVDAEGNLCPVHGPQEFFILNEKLQGYDYFHDLQRIRSEGLQEQDQELTRGLARWLADVHAQKHADVHLYFRRVRELVGASECIMGLVDEAYPHPYAEYPEARFEALEHKVLEWRWKLKRYAHRLSAVHGDLHPWNVLVDGKGDFSILDRSRGEWGEPAGDLASMAINYLLMGLYDRPCLQGDFERLYQTWFSTYLEVSGDEQALEVIAPFFVFRALVVASPEWYPDHPLQVRKGLFRFMENILEEERFDWEHINRYME